MTLTNKTNNRKRAKNVSNFKNHNIHIQKRHWMRFSVETKCPARDCQRKDGFIYQKRMMNHCQKYHKDLDDNFKKEVERLTGIAFSQNNEETYPLLSNTTPEVNFKNYEDLFDNAIRWLNYFTISWIFILVILIVILVITKENKDYNQYILGIPFVKDIIVHFLEVFQDLVTKSEILQVLNNGCSVNTEERLEIYNTMYNRIRYDLRLSFVFKYINTFDSINEVNV